MMYTRDVSRNSKSFIAVNAARYAASSAAQSRSLHFGPPLSPTPGLFTRNVANPERDARSQMSCVNPSSTPLGCSAESQLSQATSNSTGSFPLAPFGRVRNTSNGYPAPLPMLARKISVFGIGSRPGWSCCACAYHENASEIANAMLRLFMSLIPRAEFQPEYLDVRILYHELGH